MRIKILVLALMLGIVGRVDAIGVFYTSGQLLSVCESENHGDLLACNHYLSGIVDAHEQLSDWGRLSHNYICFPGGIDTIQIRKVYIKHANEHPEDLHFTAASIVLNAFRIAFPCE